MLFSETLNLVHILQVLEETLSGISSLGQTDSPIFDHLKSILNEWMFQILYLLEFSNTSTNGKINGI